jgi:WS/DGAT/MGAT family acyltransferase
MRRKKVAFADHAWLRMDNPLNPMVITGLMTFDAPLDIDRLKDVIEKKMLRFRKFRQRVSPSRLPYLRPSWEDDPAFDLNAHVERVTLPAPGDQHALQRLIGVVMSSELDTSRPLWHFYIVENYDRGSALIVRLHHSIADGISLMQVLLSLTEEQADPSMAGEASLAPASSAPVKTKKSSALPRRISLDDLIDDTRKMFDDPFHARLRARQAAQFAAGVGKIALRWPDPRTVFKGPLGYKKCAAVSEPVDLADVKSIGKAFDSTVNDVLLSAVAGALGRYLRQRAQVALTLGIRGVIPVNLRPVELDENLGNKFGLVFLSLPLGIVDPVARLEQVKKNMDDLKSSVEPLATYGILTILGAAPARIERLAVNFFDTKGTTVMTNVPGPQAPRYLAGVPINTIMAWVPQTGRISLGISIISYNGKVWLGVATDEGLVPDPETIVTLFVDDYNELKARAFGTPFGQPGSSSSLVSKLDETLNKLDELLISSDHHDPP